MDFSAAFPYRANIDSRRREWLQGAPTAIAAGAGPGADAAGLMEEGLQEIALPEDVPICG